MVPCLCTQRLGRSQGAGNALPDGQVFRAVDIVERRQQTVRHPASGCTSQGLLEHRVRSPLNVCEKLWRRLAQPDQVVPAVIGWAQDHVAGSQEGVRLMDQGDG